MSKTAITAVKTSPFVQWLEELTAKQKTFLQMDERGLLNAITNANKHLTEWADYFREQDRMALR